MVAPKTSSMMHLSESVLTSNDPAELFMYGDVLSDCECYTRVKVLRVQGSVGAMQGLGIIEKAQSPYRLVETSCMVYAALDGIPGVPKVTPVHDELSGSRGIVLHHPMAHAKTLDCILHQNGGSIPMDLLCNIARQCFRILGAVHARGYAIRNIKPDTFVLHNETVYLANVSLAKRVIVAGKHVSCRQRSKVIQHPAFASLSVHSGFAPMRKDDIEAMVYVLIYLSGLCPQWEDCYQPTSTYEDILRANSTSVSSFSEWRRIKMAFVRNTLPVCFMSTLQRARNLWYLEEPDTEKLQALWLYSPPGGSAIKRFLAVAMGFTFGSFILLAMFSGWTAVFSPSAIIPCAGISWMAAILSM